LSNLHLYSRTALSTIIQGCKKREKKKLEKAMTEIEDYILKSKAESAGAGAK
jgi:hypothetical protein